MSVRVEYDEDGDTYRLMDDVDGVPITFAQVHGGEVRSRVANVKAATIVTPEATDTGQAEGQPAIVSPPAAETAG